MSNGSPTYFRSVVLVWHAAGDASRQTEPDWFLEGLIHNAFVRPVLVSYRSLPRSTQRVAIKYKERKKLRYLPGALNGAAMRSRREGNVGETLHKVGWKRSLQNLTSWL